MVDCSSEILFVQFSIDYQMKTVQGVAPIQMLGDIKKAITILQWFSSNIIEIINEKNYVTINHFS